MSSPQDGQRQANDQIVRIISTFAPSEPRFVIYSVPRALRAAAITRCAAVRISRAGASIRYPVAMCLPSTEISLSRARRFNVNAARPVIPEPAKKSTTTSPGFVNACMKGWIAPIGTFVR